MNSDSGSTRLNGAVPVRGTFSSDNLDIQLVTVDHLARGSMKNAAKCASACELQDTMSIDRSNAHGGRGQRVPWSSPVEGRFQQPSRPPRTHARTHVRCREGRSAPLVGLGELSLLSRSNAGLGKGGQAVSGHARERACPSREASPDRGPGVRRQVSSQGVWLGLSPPTAGEGAGEEARNRGLWTTALADLPHPGGSS